MKELSQASKICGRQETPIHIRNNHYGLLFDQPASKLIVPPNPAPWRKGRRAPKYCSHDIQGFVYPALLIDSLIFSVPIRNKENNLGRAYRVGRPQNLFDICPGCHYAYC